MKRMRLDTGGAPGRALALLLGLGLASCPGDVDDPGRFSIDPSTCADVEGLIFAQRCAGAACHEQAKPAAELDLASPGVFPRLLQLKSEGCSQRRLVDPAAPEESFLVQKLAEGVGCGERMPSSGQALTEDEVDCVVRWIRRGGDADDGGIVSGDGASADGGVASGDGASTDGGADADVVDAGEAG